MRTIALAMMASLLISGVVSGCGSSGSKPPYVAPAPSPSPEPEDEGLGLTTEIGMHTMSYSFPFLTSCIKRLGPPALGEYDPATSAIDGTFTEWINQTPFARDAAGDAPIGVDINLVYLARQGDDLVLAVTMAQAADTTTMLEFGGAQMKNGSFQSEVRRLLKVVGTTVTYFDDGEWRSVAGAVVARGEAGFEVLLRGADIGDAPAWPTWWLRVFNTAGSAFDSTAATFRTSLLGGDVAAFKMTGCGQWTTQPTPFDMHHLEDLSTGAESRPLRSISESSYQLARLAFDAVHGVHDDVSLPIESLAVFAVGGDSTNPVQIDDLPALHSELYGALKLDVRPLLKGSVTSFPQGVVFSQAAKHFLELYLHGVFPDSPWYLRAGVAQALLDRIETRFMGFNYRLDRFPGSLDSYWNATTSKRLLPLGLESETSGRAQAKARAFGHLLGTFAQIDELVKTWAAAGKASGAPAARFKKALGLLNPKAVETLWPGWVEAGAFDADGDPSVLKDTDGDGVPSFLERVYVTKGTEADSDFDGWSDLAEIVLSTDPNLDNAKPSVVVPDGNFTDWLALFPKRIHLDKGRTGSCPHGADITHYAALVTRDDLIIAAHAEDFKEGESPVHWEALVNIVPEGRVLKLTANETRPALLVHERPSEKLIRVLPRAMPMGRSVVEWTINRQDLGIGTYFNETDAMTVRLGTIHESKEGKREPCDQTAWFAPYVHAVQQD